MTARDEIQDHAPTSEASIDDLLRRLDETVTIHQRWNRLRAERDDLVAWVRHSLALSKQACEHATDSDDAWGEAIAYEAVLRHLGAWDQ